MKNCKISFIYLSNDLLRSTCQEIDLRLIQILFPVHKKIYFGNIPITNIIFWSKSYSIILFVKRFGGNIFDITGYSFELIDKYPFNELLKLTISRTIWYNVISLPPSYASIILYSCYSNFIF